MEFLRRTIRFPSDFRTVMNLAVAVAGIAILTPFAANNFIQGRMLLGVLSSLVVIILGVNALLIRAGRFSPFLVVLGLVPAILYFLHASFEHQGIIAALWCFPSVLAFYMILPERQAWVANVVLLGMAGYHSHAQFDAPIALRIPLTLFAVSVFSALFIRIIAVQQERLRRQAETDSLSGLYNRMTLDSTLEQAFLQAGRTGEPACLVGLDIDHFKALNDNHGHAAGDAAIKAVGAMLRGRVRRSDRAFRLGGEEFLVLFYGADRARGCALAEELRAAIAGPDLVPGCRVTASFGVAETGEADDWTAWLKHCDANMYAAKTQGRNRVVG